MGAWRLWGGRCPKCNSEFNYQCDICNGYRDPYPPENSTKEHWKRQFNEQVKLEMDSL